MKDKEKLKKNLSAEIKKFLPADQFELIFIEDKQKTAAGDNEKTSK